MKKSLFKIILFLSVFLGIANADISWSTKNVDDYDVTNTLTDKHAINIMNAITNLPWIEEGVQQESGKIMYIFFFPECPASYALYKETRKYLNDVTIRWIAFTGDDDVGGLYETRTPEALKQAFTKHIVPEVKNTELVDNIISSMRALVSLLQVSKIIAPDGNMYFPTVIYGDEKKAWISISPQNIKEIINNIPETTFNKNPLMVEKAGQNYSIQYFDAPIVYKKVSDGLSDLMIYPDAQGIRVGGLEKGLEFPIVGYTHNGYVVLDMINSDDYLYIHDEDFVNSLKK